MATVDDIIRIAKAEIGKEKEIPAESNNIKYNTEFYGYPVQDPDANGNYIYPWCVVFVWWVFRQAGASSLFCGGTKTASSAYVYDYYLQRGRVYSSPKPGDLAVIKKNGKYTHTGIVMSGTASNFTTIDGNSSDVVKTNTRPKAGETVYFCRPAYNSSGETGSSGNLSMGSSGADVKDMQKKLIALGYNCGSAGADGQFGQGTYNAVCAFQRAKGLDIDGIIGPATRAAINSAYAALGSSSGGNLSIGSSGADVKDMQKKLIALGYNCGSAGADGQFGQGTYNAVCAFQRDHGLTVDGIIGPATRAKINALYSQR